MERDGNNALIHRYVYGAHRISMTAGTKVYYFHYDPLGSIVNLTSSTGATEWTDSFEPYGLVHSETMNDTKAPAQVVKFAGEYLDPTGLYHLRARQYDPSTGRFLTLDPLPNPTIDPYMSAYTYANDRPTVLSDPRGMRPGNPCGNAIRCVINFAKSREGQKALACGLFTAGAALGVADAPIVIYELSVSFREGLLLAAGASRAARVGTTSGGLFIGSQLIAEKPGLFPGC